MIVVEIIVGLVIGAVAYFTGRAHGFNAGLEDGKLINVGSSTATTVKVPVVPSKKVVAKVAPKTAAKKAAKKAPVVAPKKVTAAKGKKRR